MVLSSGYIELELHECSKQSVQCQKGNASQNSSKGNSAAPRLALYKIASTAEENPKIPDPSLFNFALGGSENDSTRLPSVAECATHLELLQAFYYLRQRVLSSKSLDTVLGIRPEPRTVYRKEWIRGLRRYERKEVKLRDNTFEERRKVKWPFYLGFAAARFLWWVEAVKGDPHGASSTEGSLVHLPPIDVLMVYHALLLNPGWLQSFEKPAVKKLQALEFPWTEIHQAIDSDKGNWPYKLSNQSSSWFREQTGLEPDLFKALFNTKNSTKLRKLLGKHGISKGDNQTRGLTIRDVDAVLHEPTGPEGSEIVFLECLRNAISKDRTITNLVEAVQRQASFVDKMERKLWIRSPAAEGTLSRAIERYGRFLKLFRLYPRTMLVPTLDIDLVWHTHQCSSSRYKETMVKLTGRWIDHDDKLKQGKLDVGFTKTEDLYRIRFAHDYEICNCWDCEMLLSAISNESSNAGGLDKTVIACNVRDKVLYYRAVEIARRKGHSLLPIRT